MACSSPVGSRDTGSLAQQAEDHASSALSSNLPTDATSEVEVSSEHTNSQSDSESLADMDIEEVVQRRRTELSEAEARLGSYSIDLIGPLSSLANALYLVWERSETVENLEEQVGILTRVLELVPADANRTPIFEEVASSAWELYMTSERPMDCETALSAFREVLHAVPVGHPDRRLNLCAVAAALLTRFHWTRDDGDLTEAILLLTEALALYVPGDDDDRCHSLAQLSVAYDARFKWVGIKSGDLADLNKAIELDREALSHRAPGHDSRGFTLINLSNSLRARFEYAKQAADLDESIMLVSEALKLCPPGNDNRDAALSDLAKAISARFNFLGDHKDLDQCISLYRDALALRPPGHSFRSETLNTLSHSLGTRFYLLGNAADLDEAVEINRAALEICPRGHPDHVLCSSNLAGILHIRFRWFAQTSDLDSAVQLCYSAKECLYPDDGSDDARTLLGILSEALNARYHSQQKTNVGDLNQAIDLLEEALRICPLGLPEFGAYLNNLASMLYERSSREHESSGSDLSRSIDLYQKCLDTVPSDHRSRGISLVNLSLSLLDRFEKTKQELDAERAIGLHEEAQRLLARGRPQHCWCMIHVAESHLFRAGRWFDLDRGIVSLCEALKDAHIIAQDYFTQAISALNRLYDVEAWKTNSFPGDFGSHVVEAYQLLVGHLPEISYLGLDNDSRLRVLAQAQDVATEGASYALLRSMAIAALKILEAGRAVFWRQALRLRTSVSDLPHDLSERLATVSRKLEMCGQRHYRLLAVSVQGAVPVDEEAERRRLTKQFESLMNEARAQPAHRDTLSSFSASSVLSVADKGPVVVLVASRISCDAIVILPNDPDPRHVPLPGMSLTRLEELSGNLKLANSMNRHDDFDGVSRTLVKKHLGPSLETEAKPISAYDILSELWGNVVEPIVIGLNVMKSSARKRPRLWWCPTGQFAFIPIHAAGIYKRDIVHCCSDYFVSSYIPHLTALLTARHEIPSLAREDVKVLLAAVPATAHKGTRWRALPYTIQEVQTVRATVPAQSIIALPTNEDCGVELGNGVSVRTIMDKLPEASILHLACHGRQSPTNPLESGFAMHDDMLTVEDLMTLNLPNAFLAFLSACETAHGDKAQPDQIVHLAAAMLFTGFRSVIATMWPMSDVDGPTVSHRVYAELFREGTANLDPDNVPYALDEVVRELRANGAHPSRWATFIHLGL